MPISLTAVIAIATLAAAIFTSAAQADIDNSCEMRIEQTDGQIIKTLVDRKAQDFLGSDLIVTFDAAAYTGGEPVPALFLIQGRNDKTFVREVDSEITDRWDWRFQIPTPFGLVSGHCQ